MKQYRQLIEEDRIEIYAMKQAGNTQRQMVQHHHVHPSTICRELNRSSVKGHCR
jgi:IS30 family transposase